MSDRLYSEVLEELQRILRQLSELQSRLARCPLRVNAARNRVAAAEKLVGEVQEQIKATKMTADRKQLQLRDCEAKIEATEAKLNAAQSNEEFQILKEQVAAAEMANSVMADEILEALEKIDQLDTKEQESRQALAKVQQECEIVEREVEEQRQQLETEISKVLDNLEGVEKDLHPDIRADYKRVVKTKGETALASVVEGYCGECNVQVRIQTLSDLKLGKPVFCSTCGAFLYMPNAGQ